jgi:hypothetical protein
MADGLIKITPNKEKAKSILNMVNVTLDMIKEINSDKFASIVVKDYYDVIRELISIIILLDGYKTEGEGAHKRLIDYLYENYNTEINKEQTLFIDDLRILRNRISYDGFFVKENYLINRKKDIDSIIIKLKKIINKKL